MGWWSNLVGARPQREIVADGADQPAPKADGADGRCVDPGEVLLYDPGAMGREFVEILYERNKLAARIVDLMAEDMTQLPLTIDAGIFNGPKISEAIDEQHGRMLAAHAMIYSRLYGGGGLLAFVEDGRAPSEPVDYFNVTRIAGFAPVHRYELRVQEWDRAADSRIAGMPNYGQPIMYRAQPLDGAATINGRSVAGLWHRSRVIPWTNIPTLPRHRRYKYDGWSPGELERIIDALLARMGGMGHLENLLRSFGFDVVKIQGLRSQLSSVDGQKEVQKRLRQLSKSLQITEGGVRVVAIDAGGGEGKPGESLEPMARPVNGVRDLTDAQKEHLQEISDYPQSILWGRVNAGLGNGEALGEKQAYYGLLASKQPRVYVPQMRQMAELLCAAKNGPTGGVIPPRLVITCPSLWTLPEDVASKTRLEHAQARDLDRKHLTLAELRTDKDLLDSYTLGVDDEPKHQAALAALDSPTADELKHAVSAQAAYFGKEATASAESARALLRVVPRLAAMADELIPDLTEDAAELDPATGLPLPPPPPPEKIPLDLLAEVDVRRKLLIGRKRIADWVAAGRLKPWPAGNLRRYSEADLIALLTAERGTKSPQGDAQDWPAGGLPWRMIRQADESGFSGTGEVVRGLVMRDGSVISWWVVDGKPPRPIVDSSWTNFYTVHIEQHPTNDTLVEQLLPGGDDDEWISVADLASGPRL